MCTEQCDGCRLNSTGAAESDVCVQSSCVACVCLPSNPLSAPCFLGLGLVGLCAMRLPSSIDFNHTAISLFSQKNPIAE